jgi:hypothetical protein
MRNQFLAGSNGAPQFERTEKAFFPGGAIQLYFPAAAFLADSTTLGFAISAVTLASTALGDSFCPTLITIANPRRFAAIIQSSFEQVSSSL